MTDLTRKQIEAMLEAEDDLMLVGTHDLARQLLATMTERDEAQAAQAGVVERVCMAVSEQSDWPEDEHGRTEQPALFARVINAIRSLADPTGVKLLAELRERAERADELGKRLGRRIHAQRVRLRQMEGFKCRCCDLMALRLQRLKRSNEYRARAEAAEAQLAEAQKREAGLIASLTEVKEELLWNAFHAGHEQSGFWDHCCMSDGEWLVRECGFDIAQRVYSAQSIRDRIPEAAKRAALSAAPTGEESNG